MERYIGYHEEEARDGEDANDDGEVLGHQGCSRYLIRKVHDGHDSNEVDATLQGEAEAALGAVGVVQPKHFVLDSVEKLAPMMAWRYFKDWSLGPHRLRLS